MQAKGNDRDPAKGNHGYCQRYEQLLQTAAEGFDDQPAYGSRNDQPRGARKNRPHHPACTLPCKIQQHADPKDSIERRNDAQIERSYREHGRIAAEQFEPSLWKYRGGEPDRLGQGGGN